MTYSSEVLADSPTAYWRMGGSGGGTLTDSSGNGRNGTHHSAVTQVASLLTGDADPASKYDNTSAVVSTIPSGTWMDTAHVSVETWIKADFSFGGRFVVCRDVNGAAGDLAWRLDTSNTVLRWIVRVGSSTVTCEETTGTITAANLRHVVATFDGSNLRLYLNAVLVKTVAASGSIPARTTPIYIGNKQGGGSQFNGVIDEVSIYSTALSQARILAHYNAGAGISGTPEVTGSLTGSGVFTADAYAVGSYREEILPDSPLAYWPMGDPSTTMLDASGSGRHGTHTSVTPTTGIVPTGASTASAYGASSSSVVADAAWMNTTVVTAEAWVTFPNTSGEHFVLARDNNGGDLRWRLDTAGTTFRWYVNVSGTYRSVEVGTMVAGTLYHIVGTYDGTTLRLYINGVQVGTAAFSGAIVATSGREIRLGLQSSGLAALNGTLDEAAVYGTALSAARVLAHYNKGAGIEIPAVNAPLAGSGSFSATVVPVVSVTASLTGASSLTVTARALGPNLHPDPQHDVGDGTGWWFGTDTSSLPSGLPAEYDHGVYIDKGSSNPETGLGFVAYGPAMEVGRAMTVGAWVRAVSDSGWSGRAEVELSMVTDTVDWDDYDVVPGRRIVLDTEEWRWVEFALPTIDPTHPHPNIDFLAYLTDATPGPEGGKVRVYATGVEIRQEVWPAAPLTGSGAFTATAQAVVVVAAALSGSGSLTAVVEVVVEEVAGNLAGSGVLAAVVEVTSPEVAAPLAGSGVLTAAVETVSAPQVIAALSGSGVLTAVIVEVEGYSVAGALTGTGFLSAQVFVPFPSGPTIRWKLRDTATDVEWTMPINPDSMSSPLPRRSLKFGYGWRRDGRVRTFAGPGEAREWEWSGAIRTKEHYDRLVEWAEKSVAIDVTDHLGRTFRVFVVEFNPIDRRSTPRTPWRLRYTMKVRVLERVG